MPFGDWDGDGETSLPEALGTAAALDALLGRGVLDALQVMHHQAIVLFSYGRACVCSAELKRAAAALP